jgi:hypothetical protein
MADRIALGKQDPRLDPTCSKANSCADVWNGITTVESRGS